MWLLLLVGFLTAIYYLVHKRLFYWKERGIDQLRPSQILSSVMFGQPKSIAEGIEDWYNQFPEHRYAGVYQLHIPTLMIRDPELIKQLTIKDFNHFVDHRLFASDGVEPMWEKNIFALKGEKWRDMRATLSPTFTSSKMRGMFVFMSECAQEFVQYFVNQNVDIVETEMKDNLTRFTNDVIASAAFGFKCNSLKERENDFYMMGKKLTNFTGTGIKYKFALATISTKLLKLLELSLFDRDATNYFKQIVASNVATRERENIIRPDMIHLLMEARKGQLNHETKKESDDVGFAVIEESDIGKDAKRQKPPLTLEDLTAQAFIFFFAGFGNVSTVLSFLCHELALNPEIQRRLQSEVDTTWEEYRSVTYEGIAKMKYMDMVISETLRKWPPAVAVDRICTTPYTIEPTNKHEKPVQLLKDEMLWLPVFAIHRDPQYYPNPEKFDPERFSNENKNNIRPYTYFPFGVGPRSCIANRFALLEMKALTFHLLRTFDIVPTAKTQNPIKLNKNVFGLLAEDGFWVGLKRRQD